MLLYPASCAGSLSRLQIPLSIPQRYALCVCVFVCVSPRQSRGYETSPLTRRKSYDRAYRYSLTLTLRSHSLQARHVMSFLVSFPRLRLRILTVSSPISTVSPPNPCSPTSSSTHPWDSRPTDGYTPPSSPPLRTRNDRNVFSRLTSNQTQGSALDKWAFTHTQANTSAHTSTHTELLSLLFCTLFSFYQFSHSLWLNEPSPSLCLLPLLAAEVSAAPVNRLKVSSLQEEVAVWLAIFQVFISNGFLALGDKRGLYHRQPLVSGRSRLFAKSSCSIDLGAGRSLRSAAAKPLADRRCAAGQRSPEWNDCCNL